MTAQAQSKAQWELPKSKQWFPNNASTRKDQNSQKLYLSAHAQSKAHSEDSRAELPKSKKWFPNNASTRKDRNSQNSYLSAHAQSKAHSEDTRARKSVSQTL